MQENRLFHDTINAIKPRDGSAERNARARLDALCKPPGSLGRLEDMAAQLCGIAGGMPSVARRCVLIFCADNGVALDGVASAPQSVTTVQTINFTKGITGVAVLAKLAGATLRIVDVGIASSLSHPDVINAKIMPGTHSIARGAAMSREQALTAIEVGIRQATLAYADNDVLGIGEMGIGNTTTSSAVLASLADVDIEGMIGRGAGLSDEGVALKLSIVRQASQAARESGDVVSILARAGGLDICAMCGAFLAAAALRKPVVIDGYISAVAALCAVRLCPQAADYMITSHASEEPGYAMAIRALGMQPVLSLDMRLGEGSGCPLAFQLLDAALAIYTQMATFAEAQIDQRYLDAISFEGDGQ